MTYNHSLPQPRHRRHTPDVTLLRALRPDVGGWVTLSPKYWTGVPSGWGPGSLLGGSRQGPKLVFQACLLSIATVQEDVR